MNENNLSLEEKKEANKKIRETLNQVEGYYPEAELQMFEVKDENGTVIGTRSTLLLNSKREWFYLKYPNGCIKIKVLWSEEYSAKAQAFLYADRSDDPTHYIREATATCSMNPQDAYCYGKTDKEIVGMAENKAKSKAESNALFSAGFGFQLEEPDQIDQMVDTEVKEAIEKSSLPLPTPPKTVPKKSQTVKEKKAEAEKEAKMKEKEAVLNSGNPEGEGFKPEVSPAEDVPMNQGSILDFIEEPEVIEEPKETVEPDIIEEDVTTLPLSFDEAKQQCCSNTAFSSLGEVLEKKPQMIVWLIENSKDKKEISACNVIAQNDDVVHAIAERKGLI